MNWKKIIMTELMLLMIFMTSNTAVSDAAACTRISKLCNRSADCCDGCCFEEICAKPENCMMESNPCSGYPCPPTTVCHLQQVQCLRSPCPPILSCKPTSDD